MSKKDLRKVVILGTGGTIAGIGEPGLTTGYFSGGMDIDALITGVPGLKDLAWLVGEQIANVNSDDITQEDWLRLTRRINELAKFEDIAGFVITHGTDTLEETAFFLNLTVKTRKPVVITGAMRPATALSPDGPFNLYQAVALAASPEAIGKGVLAVFSDAIYSARDVQKGSTFHVDAFSSDDFGCLGYIRDTTPYFYNAPVKRHTVNSGFDLGDFTELPKVAISYFHVDADPETLRFQYMKSDGLIIAGAPVREAGQSHPASEDRLLRPAHGRGPHGPYDHFRQDPLRELLREKSAVLLLAAHGLPGGGHRLRGGPRAGAHPVQGPQPGVLWVHRKHVARLPGQDQTSQGNTGGIG